jgi:translation initiation factor 2 subunit 1
MKPRAVSENDDLELQQLMAKMEKENAEISGDESEGGDSDEGEKKEDDSEDESEDDEA